MFTERELLILSYCVDKAGQEMTEKLFFSKDDANLLCNKIHNMLRATRLQDVPPETRLAWARQIVGGDEDERATDYRLMSEARERAWNKAPEGK